MSDEHASGAAQTAPTAGRMLAPGGDNAIAVTLGLLGDEWNLWILRHSFQGALRYRDWMSVGGISHAVLSARLAALTEAGLFDRVCYQERPARYEYRRTQCGHAVWPILLSVWSWELQWAPDEGILPSMRHSPCGHQFTPVTHCAACGRPASARDVVAEMGPSGGWTRSVPAASSRRRSSGAARPPRVLPHTMELLGNRWSAAMLGAAFFGAQRYSEFAERMQASPTIVADRLRTFLELGVLRESPSTARTDWVTYHLTEKGRAFFPVVLCMITWGQHWFPAPEGEAIVFTHTGCGRPFVPRLVCDHCETTLEARTVSVEPRADQHLDKIPSAASPSR
ncbi:winged helix-turn-helix transcriptional regulator [Rhodococcus sp. TAF43]|uniref:winged helix-turn-helix transcriptional regulator n=1 Tax=unclassified Rhodococcus (in: high G+C Gram-positive bacteria) TaxID=192944 RepID=UPI001581EAC0|nr:helix-turn-helix domain-containing protein [Rhodococcus sp. W8901]QKT10311.1 helix-turn-helix transcriptional regulator [Rhodococcus sp. W8901]